MGFLDPAATYAPEFFDNVGSVMDADDVAVPEGGLTDNINAALGLSGHITGTVTNLDGIPLPEVFVDLYRNNGTAGSPDWELLDSRDKQLHRRI